MVTSAGCQVEGGLGFFIFRKHEGTTGFEHQLQQEGGEFARGDSQSMVTKQPCKPVYLPASTTHMAASNKNTDLDDLVVAALCRQVDGGDVRVIVGV
jgi:hypothetical protein